MGHLCKMETAFQTFEDCLQFECFVQEMKTSEINILLRFVCELGEATTFDHRFKMDIRFKQKGVDGRMLERRLKEVWEMLNQYHFVGIAAWNFMRKHFPQYLKPVDNTHAMIEQRARQMAQEIISQHNAQSLGQ